MWGNLKSYLYETSISKKQEIEFHDIEAPEDDWVFVNIAGEEMQKREIEKMMLDENHKQVHTSRMSPLPLLDISNSSSPQISPPLSPSKIEEDWLIAPPPCFVLNCPSMIEISPLEDLLIEHPSMSVYSRVPGFCKKEKKVESSIFAMDNIVREASVKSRTNSLSNDKVPVFEGIDCSKKAIILSKSHPDLKAFFDQTENLKPAQQAKWENEQYKLCPSYIKRQNRVHQYQSRKHHNQKKKSLARPFAEKCKHTF